MDKKEMMKLTNGELARKMNCTARQISKSRKRGYITDNDGKRVSFRAPKPVFLGGMK